MAKVTTHTPSGGGPKQGSMDAADQMYDGMIRMEHFFEENWKQLLLVLGGIVLIGCMIVGVREYYRGQEAAAAAAYYDAATDESPSASREALKNVGEEYAGTGGGLRAAFSAAQLAYDAKEYEEAAALYRGIVESYGNSALKPAAQVALGGVLESQGSAEEAEALYRAVLSDNPDSYAIPQARLALGRLSENAGRVDEAIEYYEAIVDAASGLAWTETAQGRLNELRPANSTSTPAFTADGAATP